MIDRVNDIFKHQGFRRYAKNTSWLLAEKILRMLVGLFVGIWVARYLGPEQFGMFSYSQSFVGLFVAISTLGLDGIVVRELVKDGSRTDAIIGTSFWLKIVGAMLVFFVLSVAIKFTSNDYSTNVMVFVIASATIFQSFNVIDLYFQSKVLSRYAVYSNVISLFFSSVLKILLILNDAPLLAFACVVVFDSVVLAVGYIYYYLRQRNLSFFIFSFDLQIAIELLRTSWPLILSGSVLMIQARIDQVMLKEMIGVGAVGVYSVALRLIEVFMFLPLVVKSSLYPSIQNSKKVSNDLYQERLLNFYRLNFILFLLTAVPIFIFSESIVSTLFGVEYKEAGALLALMAARLFFANMGIARGVYMLTENLMKYSLLSMVLGTIANIVLNYLWIEPYGAKGAILATIFSFAISVFIVDFFYYKTRLNVFISFRGICTFYRISLKAG